MFKQMVLIVSLLASSNILAEDSSRWVQMQTNIGSERYVDINKIKVIDTERKILNLWVKQYYLKSTKGKITKITKRTDNSIFSIDREQINCSTDQARITSSTVYNTYTNGIKNEPIYRNYETAAWEDLLPDSVGEAEANFVCKNYS